MESLAARIVIHCHILIFNCHDFSIIDISPNSRSHLEPFYTIIMVMVIGTCPVRFLIEFPTNEIRSAMIVH